MTKTKADPSKQDQTETVSLRALSFRKTFLYILVAGLITTAVIAIVTILVGEWNDLVSRIFALTISCWFHVLVFLALISIDTNQKTKKPYNNILSFTLYGLTVASFITSVFNIFSVFSELTSNIYTRLYFWYFLVFLASLISQAVLTFTVKRPDYSLKIAGRVTIVSTILFVTLLLPSVFLDYYILPEIYHKLCVIVAIIACTAAVISLIFGKVYIVKHPEIISKKEDSPEATMPLWAKIICAVVAVFFGIPLLLSLIFGVTLAIFAS